MNETLTLLAALVLGTIGVARATRLVVADAYPPMVWVRNRFLDLIAYRYNSGHEGAPGWEPLVTCPFCFSPYAGAVSLTWAVWSQAYTGPAGLDSWSGWWWLLNIWAAVSYVAAMIVVRDEPPEEV